MRNVFLLLLTMVALSATPVFASDARTVVDMQGRTVALPATINKVATVDDGFIEEVMIHFGLTDSLAAVSSRYMLRELDYSFETVSGENICYKSTDVLRVVYPRLMEIPSFQAMEGGALNFEVLAQIQPDLVILRAGDCALSRDTTRLLKTIEALESFGWATVVLHAPGLSQADTSAIKTEIALLGEIFDRREHAAKLAAYLTKIEETVSERVRTIPEKEKVSMLYMGLASFIRRMSATASAMGSDSPVSFIMEKQVQAINAYKGHGFGVHLSTEQIYALDPDLLVLSPLGGYHPPKELYEGPDFTDLAELRAIKNRRVYAMPWRPTFCAPRLQYPLDLLVMAKAAYPDRFADLSVHDFSLEFYSRIYGVDSEMAKKLRSVQMLDWMAEENF